MTFPKEKIDTTPVIPYTPFITLTNAAMPAAACQSRSCLKAIDLGGLPQDIEQCHGSILALAEDVKSFQEQIDYLKSKLFGRRSEKIVSQEGQLTLFDDLASDDTWAEEIDGDEAEPVGEETDVRAHTRRGRKPLPKDLPRVRVEHDLSAEEKCCPECGETRARIGEDISEQLEYVPASLHVIEHVRFKYACARCRGHVAEAEKPAQPIEKSLAGPGLLAHVITSKYCDHLPLNRQEQILARHGVDLSRKTLCDWALQSAAVLEPVVGAMKAAVVSGDIVNCDETYVPTQDPKNKGSTHQSYLWVYVGDAAHPFIVYDFTWTRSGAGPREFLGAFEGYFQADAFAGYNALFNKSGGDPDEARVIVEVACWAHARRKFHDARGSDPVHSNQALNQIRRLYRIEKQAKDRDLDAEDVRALRRLESRPVLSELFDWMKDIQPLVLPKSPLGKALTYSLSNQAALERYVDVGELSIDNNAAERALRRVVVGRKNWLFAGSARGGRAAAILYSLIESARRHAHDPFAYLRDLLTRLPTHPHRALADLLPDRWKPRQPES